MTDKNLEKVFQDALGRYEADVPSTLWQSVQSGLAGKAAVSGATSGAGKLVAGLGSKGALWIAGAVLVSAGSLFVVFKENKPAPQTAIATTYKQTVTLVDPPPIDKQEIPPMPAQQTTRQDKTTGSEPMRDIQSRPEPMAKSTPGTAAPDRSPAQLEQPADAQPEITPPVNRNMDLQATPQQPAVTPPVTTEKNTATSSEPVPMADPFDESSYVPFENYLVPDQNGQAKLPNKFTPNGDGYNDEFTILTTGLKALEVTIFNQAGLQIYHWNDLQGRWNGRLPSGKAAPSGTYFYSVKGTTPEGKISFLQSQLILSEK